MRPSVPTSSRGVRRPFVRRTHRGSRERFCGRGAARRHNFECRDLFRPRRCGKLQPRAVYVLARPLAHGTATIVRRIACACRKRRVWLQKTLFLLCE
eukprot:1814961-Pleurochrysis_carterae.AAC.4